MYEILEEWRARGSTRDWSRFLPAFPNYLLRSWTAPASRISVLICGKWKVVAERRRLPRPGCDSRVSEGLLRILSGALLLWVGGQ